MSAFGEAGGERPEAKGDACRHGRPKDPWAAASPCEDCLIEGDDASLNEEYVGLLNATPEQLAVITSRPVAPDGGPACPQGDPGCDGTCLFPHATSRPYALPRLVYVEWLRRERMQHSVGFLVSDTETHLVLADRFDGKHPDSRRLWTIDQGDVVIREEVRCVDPEVSRG